MNLSESNYLQQIAELGEMQSVVCTEHIRSADGIKLLPKGAAINRQVIKRLLSHKLLKPIDFTTRIEDAVEHGTLIALGREMMARETELGILLRMMRGTGFIRQSCFRVHLETPIQNKLTVAQKLQPELLEHSLRVSLAITLIGEQLGLPEQELEVLATAGLLHDLGELHLGIGDLPLEQNLNLEYWQQVRSHPLVGAMILEQFPDYKPHVGRAVREHHERLDGSGYPHGLKAGRMSRAGRLLSFTELAIGALRKYSLRQLNTIIKANLDALDPQPVEIFLHALRQFQGQHPLLQDDVNSENIVSLFRLLAQLVTSAQNIRKLSDAEADKPCLLNQPLMKIQQTLRRAGFDLHQAEATLQMIGDDRESLTELQDLLRESLFQLDKVLLEMQRQLNTAPPQRPTNPVMLQWIKDTEQSLNAASALLS